MGSLPVSPIMMQAVAREEIARRVRENQRGLVLYNPSPEWRDIPALGGSVFFPPDQGGKLVQHPRKRGPDGTPLVVRANGQVQVVDRYGKKRIKKGNKVREMIVAMPGQTAMEIVQHVISKHPDIAYLTGDKAEDARSITLAKSNFVTRRVTEAKRTWTSYENYVTAFKAKPTNTGKDPNPPTERQMRAKEIIDQNETVTGWKTFVCRTCYGFTSDEFIPYQTHMFKKHGIDVKAPDVKEKLSAGDIDFKGALGEEGTGFQPEGAVEAEG